MSKYFDLSEFLASDTAKRKGIDNTPSFEVVESLAELAEVLDGIRDAWGKPIIVRSGYRCKELNKAVGGVSNSSHLTGYAADIQPKDMAEFDHFVDFIKAFVQGQNIRYDQIIIEKSKSTKWVHIAVRRNNGDQRGMLFGMKV